jgi:hypothetical protein
VVSGAFAVLAVIGRWRHHPARSWSWHAAILLIVAARPACDARARRAHLDEARRPDFGAATIFWASSIFLTPIGLLRRLFAGNSLVHKSDRAVTESIAQVAPNRRTSILGPSARRITVMAGSSLTREFWQFMRMRKSFGFFDHRILVAVGALWSSHRDRRWRRSYTIF